MNKQEALDFLLMRQPMPPTMEALEEDVELYDNIRRLFLKEPDVQCIPLFLNSFGEGDGFGVYQLVEDVIRMYPSSVVLPHLKKSLLSSHRSVRYWSAQIAAHFPNREIADELTLNLQDSDADVRSAAAAALSDIPGDDISAALKGALTQEKDEDLIEMLRDIVASR